MEKITRLISGVGWGTLSSAAVMLLQLALLAVMARLLAPADFGLVAMANVCLRFFSYFAQMGVTPALIQKPALEPGDLHAALCISLGIGLICLGAAWIAAPIVQWMFDIEHLGLVMAALGFNFLIGGASAVSSGLLRRSGNFRTIALIDFASYAGGYAIVGLLAAYAGAGVWALVAATLVQSALGAVLGYLAARYPLRLGHARAQRRHFLHFGGRYSLIGFVEFLGSNLDALIIGKLMGPGALGQYNRATTLASLPVQQPANILTGVLFPLLSRIGDQRQKQAVGFQLGALIVGSYAFAVSLGVAVAAPDIVGVLLGPRWPAAAPILAVYALAMGPAYISHVAGVTLDALGSLGPKLKIQTAVLVMLALMLVPASLAGGAVAIAWVVVATECLRLILLGGWLAGGLAMSRRDLALVGAAIGTVALSSVAAIELATVMLPPGSPVGLRLAAEVLAGAAGLGVGAMLVRRHAAHLAAVVFMARRAPRLARWLPATIVNGTS